MTNGARARALRNLSLALAGLVAASGCVTVRPTRALDPPAIARADAVKVFAAYTARNNQANASRDLGLNHAIEDGSIGAIDQVFLRVSGGGRGPASPPYSLADVRTAIPRLPAGQYPRWFAVTATQSDNHAQTLSLFTQQAAGAPWLLSYQPALIPGERWPAFALDADGYASAVDPADPTLTVAPRDVGRVYISSVDDGASSPYAREFAPGPETSDAAALRAEAAHDSSLGYDDSDAPEYGLYALRTADGGALTLFTMHSALTHRVAPPARLTPPNDVVALLGRQPRSAYTRRSLIEHAALIPTGGRAVRIVAEVHGTVAAAGG